jgi:hypothetical protein
MDRIRSGLRAVNSVDVPLHASEPVFLNFTDLYRRDSAAICPLRQIDPAASKYAERARWVECCANRSAIRLQAGPG